MENTGLCFGKRLSRLPVTLLSQLMCRKTQRMEAGNAGFGPRRRSRQNATVCLVLGDRACTARGCHGNGFNYAASFITETFRWETVRKRFQTGFLKFWKRRLREFYCYVSIRDKKSKYRVGRRSFTSSSPFPVGSPLTHSGSSRAASLEMRPRYVGRRCSLLNFLPLLLLPTSRLLQYMKDDSLPRQPLGVLGRASAGQDTPSAAEFPSRSLPRRSGRTCPHSFPLAVPGSVPGHPAGWVKVSPSFIPDDICVVCSHMFQINV